MTDKNTDRSLFLWLLLASMLGPALGVPIRVAYLGDSYANKIWLEAGIEFLVLLAPASAVGVWLGKKVDLGPRLMRKLISRTTGYQKSTLSILVPSIAISLAFGVPLAFGLGPGIPDSRPAEIFLGALGAGLTEEILFRLGLMTLFVWILRSIVRKQTFANSSIIIGNILAAVLFAGAHLPPLNVAISGTATLDLLIGIVLFNSLAGISMGWLYTRYGLIAAVLAHSLADVVGYAIPIMI